MISRKIVVFIVTAMRTSDLKWVHGCIFAHHLHILLAWSLHIVSVFNLLAPEFGI